MNRVLSRLRTFILPVILAGFCILLSCLNYTPGTWLSGWDTLHPEFNFPLYLRRIVYGVWQEHQGLGALATQAHASEIPRLFLYWLLSLAFENSVLRYIYFFLTWTVGALGMYFFLKHIFKNSLTSFVGGIFYLFNLVTLQQYYLPLEMFATHFAALPWLLLFALKFIENKQKKDLMLFSLFTLFSTAQAHTPTLFYAYFLCFCAFITILTILWKRFRQGLLLVILTLALNSFWLLPNIYFVATSGNIVQDSKISTQFSDKAFLTSKKYGNLKDTLLLKNYLFDWGKFSQKDRQFVTLFDEWRPHLDSYPLQAIQYLFAFLMLAGISVSLVKKFYPGLAVLPIFIISFFFIGNNIPGVRNAIALLQSEVPLFKEGLRFAFTKFSFLFLFSYVIFFSTSLNYVFQRIRTSVLRICLTGFLSLAIIFSVWPAFKGNMINSDMKVNFPKEYFQTQKYFSDIKSSGRIAAFPVTLFWGWNYYSWGYEGAGFWWFGLSQPFLDREFDRWSPYNEQYYWEISYAVYSKNVPLLESVLEKYQVKHLLLDGNIINPSSPQASYFEEIEQLFSSSDKIKFVQQFNKIKIYEYQLAGVNYVYLAQDLPSIGPNYTWTNYDQAYLEQGDYISDQGTENKEQSRTYYPFRSLFTGRSPQELDFAIKETGDSYIFTKQLPNEVASYDLKLPEFDGKELLWLNPRDFSDFKYLIPQVHKNENSIEVVVPKVGGYFSAELNNDLVHLAAWDGENSEKAFFLENLLHKYGYVIKVEAQNMEGNSLLFWLENLTAKRADMEMYLPKDSNTHYLIQPPMTKTGLGYTLHFDNVSIGKQKVVNNLGKVIVNPIPFNFITGLKLVSSEISKPTSIKVKSVSHPNPSVYEIELGEVPENSTLVLSQSFHKGWKAYLLEPSRQNLAPFFAPLFGKEIKDHALVNNWSNGWQLNPMVHGSRFIVLVFWPQYLEYFGFVVAGFSVLTILFFTIKPYSKQSK
jgi:hypothetical protein